jgi:hypothetical protein
MNFADAAEQVLRENGGAPLDSKEITRRALDQGLISPRSNEAEKYVAAAIRKDNRRRQRAGESVRFVQAGSGMFGLAHT